MQVGRILNEPFPRVVPVSSSTAETNGHRFTTARSVIEAVWQAKEDRADLMALAAECPLFLRNEVMALACAACPRWMVFHAVDQLEGRTDLATAIERIQTFLDGHLPALLADKAAPRALRIARHLVAQHANDAKAVGLSLGPALSDLAARRQPKKRKRLDDDAAQRREAFRLG